MRDKITLAKIFQDWQNHLFGKIQVKKFQLKKSDLTPKGPIYTTLKEIEV
jgi:2'-5' RNA ligase